MSIQSADNSGKCKYNYLFFFVIIVLVLLGGCENKSSQTHFGALETPSSDEEHTRDFIGVVTGVDAAGGKLYLYNIDTESNVTLMYTGITYFLNKSEEQMTAAQLVPGEVVDIYLDQTTEELTKIQVSPDVTMEAGIQNVYVNTNESYISFNGQNYRYKIGLAVFSDAKLIDVMEISPKDKVTVRGVTGQVYSIVVERGHGYIKPIHYKDFIGGKMTVQGETILDISDKMLVPVREGEYEVTMQKGDFIGTRSINVIRDGEAEMDMSSFQYEKPDEGQVIFDITPVGALVYVDKKEVNISSPVTLLYGKHDVAVVLEGYTAYTGTLDVQSPNPTIKIDLASENVGVENGEVSESDTDSTKASPEPVYDNDHKITVSEPAGVQVYLNGVYKGISPVSFTKVIGTQTIILSKEGYKTKSYTVDIRNDEEDILWNFADLAAEADG